MAGMPWAGASSREPLDRRPPSDARSGGPSRPPQHNRAAFVP